MVELRRGIRTVLTADLTAGVHQLDNGRAAPARRLCVFRTITFRSRKRRLRFFLGGMGSC